MRVLFIVILLLVMPVPVRAGFMLQPTAISSPQGSFNQNFDLTNIINQSGLSSPYRSEVTDFNLYTTVATHDSTTDMNSGFTGQKGGYPQQIAFDLGSMQTIDAIALWAADSKAAVTEFRDSVSQFRLFQDTDANPINGVGPQIGGEFNALANGGATTSSQVFVFTPITTQFIQLFVDNTATGKDEFPGIGEIAFEAVIIVPEPTSLILLGIGIVIVIAYCWRCRRTT